MFPTVRELAPTEYAPFYRTYLDRIPPDHDLQRALTDSANRLADYLEDQPEGWADYRYAPGKWSAREALQHVIDTERIFSARALRLGRHDSTPLPGFDQDTFAATAYTANRSLADLVEEFTVVRRGTIALLAGLRESDLAFTGQVSGGAMSCRAMLFIAAGHTYHHLALYRDRYTPRP